MDTRQWGQLWAELALDRVLSVFRLAVGPTKITIALLALILLFFVGWVMDNVTNSVITVPGPVACAEPSGYDTSASTGTTVSADTTELDVYIDSPGRTDEFIEKYKGASPGRGVFHTLWNFGSVRFNNATMLLLKLDTSNLFANIVNVIDNAWLCVIALAWAFKYHTVYSIIYFSIVTCVISVTGGSICRCAALELARSERPGIFEALRFGFNKFSALLTCPLLPLLIVIFFGLFVVLLGLIANIPLAGELFMSLGLVIGLLFGFATFIFLAGTVAGGALMFPVIAYEGSDGLDALSRSFMYVLRRPGWTIFYAFVEIIWGTISYLFVRFFVFMILLLTYSLLDIGIAGSSNTQNKLARIWAKPDFFNFFGNTNNPANWSETAASLVIYLTMLVVVGLVIAFVISFVFCSCTVIYSLLRRKVDAVPTENIYTELSRHE